MAGIDLESLEALDDILTTHRFILYLTLPATLGGDGTRALALRCQQAVRPGVQVEQVFTGLHGHEMATRGRTVFSKTLAVTFVETSGGVVQQLLFDWKEIVVDTVSGNGAYRDEYAGSAVLDVLDVAGAVAMQFKINRVWLTDIQEAQLDGANAAMPYLVQAALSFDYFERVGASTPYRGTASF